MLICVLGMLCVAGLLVQSEAAIAQSLKRLFTTAQQREELDRLRTGVELPDLVEDVLEQISAAGELLQSQREQQPDIVYALKGIVRHSDDRYTVWLNDQTLEQRDLPANMAILYSSSQYRLQVHKPETSETFELRPGQVLNLTRGQLLESYQVIVQPETQQAAAAEFEADVTAEIATAPSLATETEEGEERELEAGQETIDEAEQALPEAEQSREEIIL